MDPDRSSAGKRAFKTFAWQGIRLTVPSTWDLVYTEGRYKAGYVRLADESVLRMELRWEAGSQDIPPSSTVDSYVAKLRKKARKHGGDLTVQRDLKLASPAGKKVECYRWVAERQALAMLSRCGECGRSVHLHVLGKPEEPLKKLTRTIFASLADHPAGTTLQWKLFDVEFETPADLPLARQRLQTGCIQLTFAKWPLRLEFTRLSLAQIVLAGADMAQWLPQFYAKALKRRSFEVQPSRLKGHPSVELNGRPWLLVNPLRLLGRRRVVRATGWHCERTNRLFVCSFDGPEARTDIFPPALKSFRCCGQTQAEI